MTSRENDLLSSAPTTLQKSLLGEGYNNLNLYVCISSNQAYFYSPELFFQLRCTDSIFKLAVYIFKLAVYIFSARIDYRGGRLRFWDKIADKKPDHYRQ